MRAMHDERGAGAVSVRIGEILQAEGIRLRDQEGRLVPGAALILVMSCERRQIDLAGTHFDEACALLGLPAARLVQVMAFHRALLDEARNDDPIVLCRGVNCTFHGAESLHRLIRDHLRQIGVSRPLCEVFCLNHCDRGPSVMTKNRIYCGSTHEVDEDQRTWRMGSGPVPIRPEAEADRPAS
jgi:NADH:ubiquinone oxidoreductase subunit E